MPIFSPKSNAKIFPAELVRELPYFTKLNSSSVITVEQLVLKALLIDHIINTNNINSQIKALKEFMDITGIQGNLQGELISNKGKQDDGSQERLFNDSNDTDKIGKTKASYNLLKANNVFDYNKTEQEPYDKENIKTQPDAEQAIDAIDPKKERINECINRLIMDETLGLEPKKKQTLVGIGRSMLEQGFDLAFVAGMLGNIMHEGNAGQFESSNYDKEPDKKPEYLKKMDEQRRYRQLYSGKSIEGMNLSTVQTLLKILKTAKWVEGRFGIGSAQWTGERANTLLTIYKEIAGEVDKITFNQILKAEGIMISRELGETGKYKSILDNWKKANAGSIETEQAAYNAGFVLCKQYETPPNSSTKAPIRARYAREIFNVMAGLTVQVTEQYRIHIVAKNETLTYIAKKYGCTQQELITLNPHLKNRRMLKIGERIRIPDEEPAKKADREKRFA